MASGGKGKLEFTRQVPNFLKGLVQERTPTEKQTIKRKDETGDDDDFKPVIVDLNGSHKAAGGIPPNVSKEVGNSANEKSRSEKPASTEEQDVLRVKQEGSSSALDSHKDSKDDSTLTKADSKKRIVEQVKPKANKKLLSFDADNDE